jgi:YVTN family beta-propeller protein
VISTATNAVSDTITVGNTPLGVSITPDGKRLYVANNGDGTISVISTATNAVSDTITVGNGVIGVAICPVP